MFPEGKEPGKESKKLGPVFPEGRKKLLTWSGLHMVCWAHQKEGGFAMRYRVLGRSGLRAGEIGVGCEGFLEKTPEEVREWVDVMEAASRRPKRS